MDKYRAYLVVLALVLALPAALAAQQQGGWTLAERSQSMAYYATGRTQILDCADAAHFAAIGQRDFWLVVRTSSDSGATWQTVRTDSYDDKLQYRAVRHPAPGVVLVLVDSTFFIRYDNQFNPVYEYRTFLLRTDDNGFHWQTVLPATTRRSRAAARLSMANARWGLFVQWADSNEQADLLWRTPDGGMNWTPVALPDGARITHDLLCLDSLTYLLRSGTVMHRTADGGNTWQRFDNLPPGMQAMHFIDGMEGWAAGALSNGNGHQQRDVIYHTTDGGATWTTQLDESIELAFGLNAVAFADAQHGIAVGQASKILRTTDGGLTWQQESAASIDITASITAVAYPAPGSAVAVCNAEYILRFTHDAVLTVPKIVAPAIDDGEQPSSTVLEWTAPPTADLYHVQVVEREPDLKFDPAEFADAQVDSVLSATTLALAGLQYARQYVWRVRAVNAQDTSGWSLHGSFLTLQGETAPAAPRPVSPLLNAQNVAVAVDLEWEAVAHAIVYDIQLSDNPQFGKIEGGVFVEQFDYSPAALPVSGLKPNTTYYWRVRAKNSQYTSLWSSMIYGAYRFTTGSNTTSVVSPLSLAAAVSVAPHPVRNEARIRLSTDVRPDRVFIVDVTGRLVADLTPLLHSDGDNGWSLVWNTGALSDGVYILRVGGGGTDRLYPLVVQR